MKIRQILPIYDIDDASILVRKSILESIDFFEDMDDDLKDAYKRVFKTTFFSYMTGGLGIDELDKEKIDEYIGYYTKAKDMDTGPILLDDVLYHGAAVNIELEGNEDAARMHSLLDIGFYGSILPLGSHEPNTFQVYIDSINFNKANCFEGSPCSEYSPYDIKAVVDVINTRFKF